MRHKGIHIITLVLLFSACSKPTDWTFSASKNSTQPFGLFLAYDRLNTIYPKAEKTTVYKLMEELHSTEGDYYTHKNKVLVSVTANLYLSNDEVDDLKKYISKGGKIILLSQYFSDNIDSAFNINTQSGSYQETENEADSNNYYQIDWNHREQNFRLSFPFPQAYITHGSEWKAIGSRTIAHKKKTNLIKRNFGTGQIILGTAPEMITNYAMVQDTNKAYYEKLFSYFPRRTNEVKWFSSQTVLPSDERSKSNFMKLLEAPSYRYAFFVLLLMALLFVFFESRRRQRMVQVVAPVTNDSLAFTEVIGKLYYGEKDHHNLALKMIRYYLEYIRTTYNIPTAHLNQEMADTLARKLNKPPAAVATFINYLNTQMTASQLDEAQIKQLYITLKKYS